MTKLKPVCPQCGSTRFRSNDTILCATGITGWSIDKKTGDLEAEHDGAAEDYWDTIEPLFPATPHECAECMHEFSDEDIIATLTPKQQEEIKAIREAAGYEPMGEWSWKRSASDRTLVDVLDRKGRRVCECTEQDAEHIVDAMNKSRY